VALHTGQTYPVSSLLQEKGKKKTYMASPVSPRTPKIQNGTEWISLLQKKVASFLFLLLVLSTVFLFSVWYSSHSFIFGGKEVLRKSALLTDHLQANSMPHVTHDEAVLPTSYSFHENYSVESSSKTSAKNPLFAS
jgi:hypothetical protein